MLLWLVAWPCQNSMKRAAAKLKITAAAVDNISNLENVWRRTVLDVARMKLVPMDDEDTAELYGRLFIIEGVMTSTELSKAVNQLRKPTFVDFAPKNMWSTYNHVTWALKDAPPHRKLDCLKKLHEQCMEITNDYLAITPYG